MKVINGTYHYLVKWKDVEQLSYVPSSYANENIPQMVITFHEERLSVYGDFVQYFVWNA